ncbi:MAG: hypothetical protein KME06_13115 [Kastovskya adunca ATA6-11-RM4]|jgi:hypothetical protein|nr:hypothetical protein [Kastovskya adunca ATA6-11-RM4]
MERKQLLLRLLLAGSGGVLAGLLILTEVVQALGVQRHDFSTNLEMTLERDDAASEGLAVSEVKK